VRSFKQGFFFLKSGHWASWWKKFQYYTEGLLRSWGFRLCLIFHEGRYLLTLNGYNNAAFIQTAMFWKDLLDLPQTYFFMSPEWILGKATLSKQKYSSTKVWVVIIFRRPRIRLHSCQTQNTVGVSRDNICSDCATTGEGFPEGTSLKVREISSKINRIFLQKPMGVWSLSQHKQSWWRLLTRSWTSSSKCLS